MAERNGMRFEISRTSNWHGEKPCEEAKPGPETSRGRATWWVDLDSLEDLLSLSVKYGELVVNENTIEIYDDYRE
jgi:hypothetical protein